MNIEISSEEAQIIVNSLNLGIKTWGYPDAEKLVNCINNIKLQLNKEKITEE